MYRFVLLFLCECQQGSILVVESLDNFRVYANHVLIVDLREKT